MNNNPTERQLIDAETKLARALQRLSALRRAALYGSYDATEFDQAVMAYREAEQEVLEARRAWAGRQDAGTGADATPVEEVVEPVEESTPEPLEITPRLLFARWLVQNGRLTDQIEEEAA